MATEEEELLLRQLPHSTEAEQAVLGSMLIDPRCVPEVIDKLHVQLLHDHRPGHGAGEHEAKRRL